MPGLPYLPAGVDELPAERFLLFADENNVIQRIDESNVQKDTTSFTGVWESGTINSLDQGKEMTVRLLELIYTAVGPSSVTVKVSSDGGQTFDTGQAIPLAATSGLIGRVAASFEALSEATGYDLRIRLELDSDVLCSIYRLRPHLVDRGDLLFT